MEVSGKKARSKEEKKAFQKKNDALSNGYRRFFNFFCALDLILGTFYIVCNVINGRNDGVKGKQDSAINTTAHFFKYLVSLELLWLNLALKGFLYSLITKIEQLIKEKNEEPEDC